MSCDCGCCSGVHAATPVAVQNRPGLSQITHRPGDWATYLQSLQANLSSARFPELASLTTRAPDDASVALCDAWAVAAEVLSFYQDRIANEGYLRTATERRSLIELGRLTGYALRPGVSASVYLAYDLDANAGRITIPVGTRAQSVPEAGEKMQTFETAEVLSARAEWSRITVRLSQPVWRLPESAAEPEGDARYGVFARGVTLAGTATQLKANDALLIDYGDGTPRHYRVAAVVPDEVTQTTQVRVRAWGGGASGFVTGGDSVRLNGRELVERLGTRLSPQPRGAAYVPRDKAATLRRGGEIYSRALSRRSPALRDMLIPALSSFAASDLALRPIKVYALRLKTGVFGSAAPRRVMTSITDNNTPGYSDLSPQLAWADLPEIADPQPDDNDDKDISLTQLPLDGLHEAIKPAGGAASPSWVLVDGPPSNDDKDAPSARVYALSGNETVTMAIGVAASAKTSRLVTDKPWYVLTRKGAGNDVSSMATLRATQVYTQSELLPLARDPLGDPVRQSADGNEIELDGYYDGLAPGMWMIAAGERADIADAKVKVPAAERAMIATVRHDVARVSWQGLTDGKGKPIDRWQEGRSLPGDTLHTFVTLAQPLAYSYRRPTFTLHGNVVRATHGETRREPLGGGDASRAFQHFTLKSPPLTYVSAATTSGVASTLNVRVSRLLWHETADLPTATADARVYATSRDDAEATTITFGDGVHGARLPSGADNIAAVYRTGLGSAGNVRAGQITLPADKPLGVRGVVNPIRASGGADPDTLALARSNAPLAVTALDRLVSVRDYEDFARGYAGIGKAAATSLRGGGRAVVHVTIAGIDDEPVDETSDLYRNLFAALRAYGDPHQPLQVQVRDVLSLVIEATIAIGPDYEWSDVQPRVRAVLLERFGFAAMELAQPVIVSRVHAAIESVRGVDHVDVLKVSVLDEDTLIDGIDPAADEDSSGGKDAAGPAGTDLVSRERDGWIAVDAARVVTAADGTGRSRPAQIAYLPSDVPDALILELAP